MRELKDVRYVPQLKKESYLIGALEANRPERDSWSRRSQDVQWPIGCSEGHSTQQLVLSEG